MLQQQSLEFAASDDVAGFRLKRLEIYNWGTFHRRVWNITPDGKNILVTGDIGSGKSTLVDGITTLMVPPQKLAYNKAAGAETRERSLRTYVLGYYKSERSESGYASRPVAFRDHNDYSVILAVFSNSGNQQEISLAQVFICTQPTGQPDRFYVVSQQALKIDEDFSDFGSDLGKLKKRLKNKNNAKIFSSFTSYAAEFKRVLGINNDQALELFNQTVSMKSVGSLTDFVRKHMLQEFDVKDRIERLLKHYNDLNSAHEAIIKARNQIEQLKKIVTDSDEHDEVTSSLSEYRYQRDNLKPFFALLKKDFLGNEKLELEHQFLDQRAKLQELEDEKIQLQARRDDIKRNIANNGGDRIARIDSDIKEKSLVLSQRQKKAQQYGELVKALDLPVAEDIDLFNANRQKIEKIFPQVEEKEAQIQNELTENTVELKGHDQQFRALVDEIKSLEQRKSNIPLAQIVIRQKICETLNITEEDIPFAGELIKVEDEQKEWEGAAEKLLHNFALSLLVPDNLYKKVSEFVDQTNLKGRIVYYRVKLEKQDYQISSQPGSLLEKLVIKPDSRFFNWLEKELGRRFDYVCCDTLEHFRKQHQAITRNGQSKSGGHRHEKDDRYDIKDRSRYVLGWSNLEKIRAIKAQSQKIARKIAEIQKRISTLENEKKGSFAYKSRLEHLRFFENFTEINWKNTAIEIDELRQEKDKLESASDVLKELGREQEKIDKRIKQNFDSLDKAKAILAKLEYRQKSNEENLQDCERILVDYESEERSRISQQLNPLFQKICGKQNVTMRNSSELEGAIRNFLQSRIDSSNKKLKLLEERIISAMQNFKRDYPLETQEFDARIESADDFRDLYQRLTSDDLPAFEKRFKRLLNENTINEIASFNAQLNKECNLIKERIEKINNSLAAIDFNPGRYIFLERKPAPDREIRDFRQELKSCTEGSIGGSDDDQYAEIKFLKVKKIIERFKGREGLVDLDKRWMKKVTDVRNWYVFAASERWKEDDSEYEHYTDSGGKSGGQKEKLAYTVLAASLAYQFGLETGLVKSRTFRFVVIDEAFGRGSDESTSYALKLFQQMNLQLLIVTPLQKIHVIDPFVEAVAFIHSDVNSESAVRNLTIEEYRKERESRLNEV
ncbi:MAG: ATP-binding protein [Candidatus Rifleibacteriota bacterium]